MIRSVAMIQDLCGRWKQSAWPQGQGGRDTELNVSGFWPKGMDFPMVDGRYSYSQWGL